MLIGRPHLSPPLDWWPDLHQKLVLGEQTFTPFPESSALPLVRAGESISGCRHGRESGFRAPPASGVPLAFRRPACPGLPGAPCCSMKVLRPCLARMCQSWQQTPGLSGGCVPAQSAACRQKATAGVKRLSGDGHAAYSQ